MINIIDDITQTKYICVTRTKNLPLSEIRNVGRRKGGLWSHSVVITINSTVYVIGKKKKWKVLKTEMTTREEITIDPES